MVIGNMQAVIRYSSLKVLVQFSLPFIYRPVDNGVPGDTFFLSVEKDMKTTAELSDC